MLMQKYLICPIAPGNLFHIKENFKIDNSEISKSATLLSGAPELHLLSVQ